MTQSESVAYYLHNGQTVFSEVIIGESDLVNVQIFVGMIILFQSTQDLKAATMLIAIVIRLTHELGLHTRTAEQYFDTSQVVDYSSLLWKYAGVVEEYVNLAADFCHNGIKSGLDGRMIGDVARL